MSDTVALEAIRPHSTKRPKGLVDYRPTTKTKRTVARTLDLFERMREAEALPIGPRQVGYRLKEAYPGEYTKADFPAIGEVVKRLGQAGKIPFSWIADAAAVTYDPGGFSSLDTFIETAPDLYEVDRRAGQPVVVEIITEAKETLGLVRRVAAERGVLVYSGSGSSGPNLAHTVARRALSRAAEGGQSTLIFGIADFDSAGVKNILRPHIEHVSAFLYGTAGNDRVIAQAGEDREAVSIDETSAKAGFQHLALTAEMASDLVESDRDREQIAAYVGSGFDLWTRDLDLIANVQKVELESLDPVELRRLVTEAVDGVLNLDVLADVEDRERQDRRLVGDKLAGVGC